MPLFSDRQRPQLVFDLGKVQYAMKTIVRPVDPCIEALCVSGALQTDRFLDGRRGDPRTQVCSWRGWNGPSYPFHRRGPPGAELVRRAGEWWQKACSAPSRLRPIKWPQWQPPAWPPLLNN